MIFTCHYDSPLGGILLAADVVGLTGLWFDGAKYFADNLPPAHTAQETPILAEAKHWLDVYFAGREPNFTPPLHPVGSPFRQDVYKRQGKQIVAARAVLGRDGDDMVEAAELLDLLFAKMCIRDRNCT